MVATPVVRVHDSAEATSGRRGSGFRLAMWPYTFDMGPSTFDMEDSLLVIAVTLGVHRRFTVSPTRRFDLPSLGPFLRRSSGAMGPTSADQVIRESVGGTPLRHCSGQAAHQCIRNVIPHGFGPVR